MNFQGHVERGVVIFDEPVSLPELARRQGVGFPKQDEELLGGWPTEELNDGFEEALVRWREAELEDDR